jgi:hypothetical protein
MLSGLIKDGGLWIASDQERKDYADNFQDMVMCETLGDIKNNQLIAYKFNDQINLTSLECLVNTLKYTSKYTYQDKNSIIHDIFQMQNGKAIVSSYDIILTGMCPPGTMSVSFTDEKAKNHDCRGQYVIKYNIPPGKQGGEHPSPGTYYHLGHNPRTCYLPASDRGTEVLIMHIQAWQSRLLFDVGTSATTDKDNQVRWSIHQKTGAVGHTLAEDPRYLDSAKVELYPYKINEDSIKKMQFEKLESTTDHGMKVSLDKNVFKDIQETMKSITEKK